MDNTHTCHVDTVGNNQACNLGKQEAFTLLFHAQPAVAGWTASRAGGPALAKGTLSPLISHSSDARQTQELRRERTPHTTYKHAAYSTAVGHVCMPEQLSFTHATHTSRLWSSRCTGLWCL
jgi:hypothetical protein